MIYFRGPDFNVLERLHYSQGKTSYAKPTPPKKHKVQFLSKEIRKEPRDQFNAIQFYCLIVVKHDHIGLGIG